MLLNVKAKDEEGNILIDGKLNKKEVAYLIQFAINLLLADGVRFNLQDDSEDEAGDEQLRLDFDNVFGGLN